MTVNNNVVRISKKSGLPPGTLFHVGKKRAEQVKVTFISYNEKEVEEVGIEKMDFIPEDLSKSKVNWLNVDGIHQVDLIELIGKRFKVHTLTLEDILNAHHRPKAEFQENQLFFTLKMLGLNQQGKALVSEQVSFLLGENYLLSFQEQQGDLFEKVRDRIRLSQGRIRKKKTDYLFYALIDATVDNYYPIIERLSDDIEKLEQKILTNIEEETLLEIQELKKQFSILRKSIFPLREAISVIVRDESDIIDNENTRYLQDVYDHTIHIIETIESQRDLVAGLKDLYTSEQSNRMNNIMKVLTIIATIFIPLTFIAGVYGMNFKHMPELEWKYSYPVFWVMLIFIFIGMVIYFKRKKWL